MGHPVPWDAVLFDFVRTSLERELRTVQSEIWPSEDTTNDADLVLGPAAAFFAYLAVRYPEGEEELPF